MSWWRSRPRRRVVRRRKKETGPRPPVPWSDRSTVFRWVAARGWSPEGRPGTPAEWDEWMLRAYGPGVTLEDLYRACSTTLMLVGPREVLEPLERRWKGGAP